MEVESHHTTKSKFVPDDLFYKCANLQNLLMSRSIYFKGPNRGIQFNSQTNEKFPG
jgi:hypothetical protein